MASLEEIIRQRLAEATKEVEVQTVVEAKKEETVEAVISKDIKKEVESEEVGKNDEVDTKPELKKEKKSVKESSTSSQVSALLEAEGLSDEFKVQAVTIFEAAVTDRVLQIEEELKQEFDKQLAEAKAELDNDIDGFLNEAVQQWKQDNEVAIKANFKSQLAESFMDGMKALIAEHNIELPEGQEDALSVALSEVDTLKESVSTKDVELETLQEQIDQLKSVKILESFREKMTQVEFDRFAQLTDSVVYKDEAQYTKQLTIVLENFGSSKSKPVEKEVSQEVVTESVAPGVTSFMTSTDSAVSAYAKYLSKK